MSSNDNCDGGLEQVPSKFLVLTASDSRPWHPEKITQKTSDANNHFTFSEKLWDLDEGMGPTEYLRQLQDFRNRLDENQHASDDPAQGWTFSEVGGLIKLWRSGDRSFRVLGNAVFPEVFVKQPLSGSYAKHEAYKRMAAGIGAKDFSPPAHILTLEQEQPSRLPKTIYSAITEAFERQINHECRKACWGIPFRLGTNHPYADYWVLPKTWTEADIRNYDNHAGQMPTVPYQDLSNTQSGFLINVCGTEFHNDSLIQDEHLQRHNMDKITKASKSGSFLIYVKTNRRQASTSSWIVIPPRQLKSLISPPTLRYNFTSNRVNASKFIEMLKELSTQQKSHVRRERDETSVEYKEVTKHLSIVAFHAAILGANSS